MNLIRVREATALEAFKVRLDLTNGQTVERDLGALMRGPVFEPLRRDPAHFRQFRLQGGALVWPNGADLCPDVLIWNGLPPAAPLDA
ncbi:MAG: DUF2442 domain-containing protein [Bryobacteraceae bacterium]